MMKRIGIVALLGLAIVLVFLLGFIQSNSTGKRVVEGQIQDIYVGGIHDVVIVLKHDSKCYFINRGIEKGLSIALLKDQLGSKNIQICMKPEGFNLFNLNNRLSEIDQIKVNQKLYYQDNL